MSIDMSGVIWAEYEKARQQAKQLEDREDWRRAAVAHRQCAELLQRYVKHLTPTGRQRWTARAHDHLARAARLESGAATRTAPEGSSDEADYSDAVVRLIQRSTVSWDDIAGLEETKRAIKIAYGLSVAQRPFGVALGGWRTMLFYGPPGTGKTLLAAATSNGLSATFFNVKVSDLVSKYFGESTRLISALFAEARGRSPSVIFLDEFDALTPPRGGGESGAERRIISTLLAELDGLATKNDDAYVLTIAATNTPWDIDKAMISRFEKKIYIPLPDPPARQRILELNLRGHGVEKGLMADLLTRTEHYSGREIARLCKEAINQMIERANPDLHETVDAGPEAVAEYQVQIAPLTADDWRVAFQRVRPGTTTKETGRFTQWAHSLE
jgi:katanin p60 ATPase-containing subunit A1